MNKGKKQTGKVNYVWVLAGGYLIYLAAQLLFGVISGSSETPVIGVAGGVVFLMVGGLLLRREWKSYQYGRAHIDDPETWSEEPEALEASEELEEDSE